MSKGPALLGGELFLDRHTANCAEVCVSVKRALSHGKRDLLTLAHLVMPGKKPAAHCSTILMSLSSSKRAMHSDAFSPHFFCRNCTDGPLPALLGKKSYLKQMKNTEYRI